MLKTKRKSKTLWKENIPLLQIIQFSEEDVQANINGILTESQKKELRKPVNIIVLAWLALSIGFSFVLQGLGYQIMAILLIGFVWHQLARRLIVKDIEISSFVGVARSYQDDSGWYIAFDDVMTFEIKDQPNKLFKPEHRYRVFMTDKDNVIIGARALD